MNKHFLLIITTLALIAVQCVFAQKTSVYKTPQAEYNDAVDLFTKAKYASALAAFDKLAATGSQNLNASAQYYAALCAGHLYHPDAADRLEAFIAKYPENAQVNNAFFELGKQLFNSKDYRNAMLKFALVDVYELNDEQTDEYHFKMGYSCYKTDNLAKAKEELVKVKDKPNRYMVPATFYYASIAYQEKNYETALKHFEKIENDETFREVISYYIVQIYSMQGKYDELIARAVPLLEKQGNSKMNNEMARLTADAFYHKDNFREAATYFDKYLNGNPVNTSRYDYYEIAFTAYKNNDFNKAVKYFQLVATVQDSLSQNAYYHLGDSYLKTGQKRYAHNAFLSAYKIKADPLLAEEALFNYAKLSIELSYNPYNEAVKALQDYINAYPQSQRLDEAYGYLADLYMVTRNYKDALASLQKVKKRNARLDAAYQKISYYRAVEQFNNSDYNSAISLFGQAQETSSDKQVQSAALYWMAESYYRLGQWEEATGLYNRFLISAGASAQPFFNTANYNLGYCYFKQGEYGQAALSFRKYLGGKPLESKLSGDANLRLGDCYFMQKDYNTAITYYQKAVSQKVPDADYAAFQVATSYGVQGEMQQKINWLQKLLKDYPRSTYFDDAYYETGNTYTIINQNSEALSYFEKVVKDYPKSSYVKKSLLKTGLIYFNQNRDSEALATLKRVVKEYPGTPESKEALASIRSIYVDQNKVDEYVDFTKSVPQADVSRSEQDSLTFIAAENQYMNGDCSKAGESLDRYLARYPEGSFAIKANFYKAECDYRSEKFDQALKGYLFVLNSQRTAYTTTAALKAARIQYTRKDYANALENFIRLEEISEQPIHVMDAVAGQMQCNYLLGKYGLCIQSAQKLLQQEGLQQNLQVEAHLYLARSAYALSNTELARKEFEETAKLSQNEAGAEAKFMIAQLQYDATLFDQAEKTLFALAEDYSSYDYWVAKGFILLSDVYVKKKNNFQAKQTLQSIIDNYEGQDLVVIAREKLNAIIESEKTAPAIEQ